MNFFLTLNSMPLLSWWSWKHSCSYYLTETHVLHRKQTDRSELTWEGGKASRERMAWLSLCREQLISCSDSLLLTLAVFLATSPIPSRTGKMPCKPKLLEHLPWANVELISEQRNRSWGHTSNSCLALTSGFFLPPPTYSSVNKCKTMVILREAFAKAVREDFVPVLYHSQLIHDPGQCHLPFLPTDRCGQLRNQRKSLADWNVNYCPTTDLFLLWAIVGGYNS